MTIQGIANNPNFQDAHSTQPIQASNKSQYNKGIIIASLTTGTIIAGALAINAYMRTKTSNLPISTTRPKALDVTMCMIAGGLAGVVVSWDFFKLAAPRGHYPIPEKPYLCASMITIISSSIGCMIGLYG